MAQTVARPFAVFDIDGTLIRWQLYHAMGDALVKTGAVPKANFQIVREARLNWKKRQASDSFQQYEAAMVALFQQTLHGLKIQDFENVAQSVFDEYKDQVYTYTRDLIRTLKQKNYLLFAISGSPDIIVGKLAGYYGFDDFAASRYETKQAIFTGHVDLAVGQKEKILKTLIDKHQATTHGSIAVGDGEGDIDMLASVEHPIAFNPSQQLIRVAMKRHWPIIVERKNVVYRLDYVDKAYRLSL
jgi:HAD superfamily hydrolase (TIGR01490 family)